METKDDFIVEGYRFATLADAETARLDARKDPVRRWFATIRDRICRRDP